jgi:hypothetical protein
VPRRGGELGTDPVAELVEGAREGTGLVGVEEVSEELLELGDVQLERLARSQDPGLGEGGEGAPSVVRALEPDDEALPVEAVDGSREPARGERGLRGQLGHAQPAAGRSEEPQEDLEGGTRQAAVFLEARPEQAPHPGRGLEDEPNEGDGVGSVSRLGGHESIVAVAGPCRCARNNTAREMLLTQ